MCVDNSRVDFKVKIFRENARSKLSFGLVFQTWILCWPAGGKKTGGKSHTDSKSSLKFYLFVDIEGLMLIMRDFFI